jgi:hypothetical protein
MRYIKKYTNVLWNSIVKNSQKKSGNHNMIKRYSSMFNCNQNYHKYKQILSMASKTWYPNK